MNGDHPYTQTRNCMLYLDELRRLDRHRESHCSNRSTRCFNFWPFILILRVELYLAQMRRNLCGPAAVGNKYRLRYLPLGLFLTRDTLILT
jgi:hypothetical protein